MSGTSTGTPAQEGAARRRVAPEQLPLPDFRTVFDEAPAPMLLLTTDFVVVHANRARLEATATTLEGTVGLDLFEAFPSNPDDPAADGARKMRSSLEQVRDARRPHTMAIQKHDIRLPDGRYEERYWSPRNVPILDERGEVVLLLHRSDDITAYIRRQGDDPGAGAGATRWRARAEEIEADLLSRMQELEDLNEQLVAARDALSRMALHDPLTGLLVAPAMMEQLARSLARLERHPGAVAVLFLDLDNLKQVNDRYGHAAGDELLRCAAGRLATVVRPADTVARVGGDEFVVVLDDLDAEHGTAYAECVAERLLLTLDEPCEVTPRGTASPSASIGVAVARSGAPDEVRSPEHAVGGTPRVRTAADLLLSQADTAMYRAKRSGRGRSLTYDAAVDAAVSTERALELELATAVAEHRLLLHYQPIVEVEGRALYGVEALLRWQHPDGTLRPAGQFIDAAERSGLLPTIGRWAVGEACRQLRAWDDDLGAAGPGHVFVNLSPGELARPGLLEHVRACLREHGLEPQRLVLEVTESGVVDEQKGRRTLQGLQELGCHLAIDDFGTGHSSLSRVVQLPVDHLKIDRSLTRDLTGNPQSRAVTEAVLALARTLQQTVVAEGVEQPEDLDELRRLGCRLAQGYHLGRPQAPEQVTAALSAGPRPPS
ncbi:putative bifunctional diguanylate cyclase/phosphodiesterase [Cellulomonas endophytica]|uniref:putative bifunctional diguanylate cyclase/phosphodiesterase n=1 Tax=Cellulomonas endophytica TaxID=2494735 RepID=UPI0013E8FBC1|nr:EAL domain-containing protein [Cellulomonas endophytica]